MKPFTLTLRTILLTLALVSTTTAFAYDFMVNGIYYDFNGDEASVTYHDYSKIQVTGSSGSYWFEYHYNYYADYREQVIIPETVTYNDVTYTVTEIGAHAFEECTEITSISIPNTVTSIGDNAFYKCNRIKNLTIPLSVTSIGNYAFSLCTGFSHFTISNSITDIGSYAFQNCYNLTTIVIGSAVTLIGGNAFYSCPLSSIICLATIPPDAGSFPNTNTAKLYVPKESVELYRTTYPWNYFTNVYGFGNDSFSVPDNMAFHGDTIVIPVSMQNESEITAFQTDIYLPEGFELVMRDGEYQVSLSDRKGRDHVIMVNDAPDGALRVLSYSPTLKAFKNNEGELFYITVKVPEGVSGSFPIWLRNTILTSTDEEELYAIDALSNVSVTNIIMGDVNSDGIVTVSDVVTTARYILNYNPEPFVFDAADMNGDNRITITDVVKIANLILDQNYDEPTNLYLTAPNEAGGRISGEIRNNTVSINLDNAMDYTAFQLDLTLPEGMTSSDFALTERANALSLNVKDRGNGKIRLMGYALDLKTIKGNEGSLLTFHVMGNGEIGVDHIALVTPEGETVNPGAFAIALDNATSVDELAGSKEIAHVDYYDVMGQRIERPENGVTLIVKTYTDGTRTTTKVIK